MGRKNSESEREQDFEDEEDVTFEEQVQNKIKELPTLADKIQAIAVNNYLIEKRKLDKQLEAEDNKIEVTYRNSYNPYLTEIYNIAAGLVDLTDEDLEGVDHILTEQEKQNKKLYYPKRPIEEYWLKSFIQSDIIGESVQPDDENLLRHLVNIEATKTADGNSLTVTFHFSENEWFNTTVLKKEFEIEGDEIKRSFGDQIEWKAGKNITVEVVKKKNKKKKTTTTKEVEKQSFFNLFKEIDLTEDDEDGEDSKKEENEEEQGDVEKLERQYEICNHIYEDILPKSLQYYLGIVGLDIGDLLGGAGGEAIAEEDEDDDEQDDEKAQKKSKSKSKKRKGSKDQQ